MLNFSKAFDKVSHQHLILKLQYYGIRGRTLDWIFHSYPIVHNKWYTCGGDVSDSVNILSGVLQIRVKTFTFLVYINVTVWVKTRHIRTQTDIPFIAPAYSYTK